MASIKDELKKLYKQRTGKDSEAFNIAEVVKELNAHEAEETTEEGGE